MTAGRVHGNRSALLRAKVPRKEADAVAGGKLYADYLPVRAAARPRELTSTVYSPSRWGLDFFLLGKKKDAKGYEGFLMMIQALSYYVAVAKIKKRSSRVI
jgi:hypothetical protein